jgi:hypothetical protein
MEHISIYPVEGKLKDGESVLLGKIHEIITWINEQEKGFSPASVTIIKPPEWISVKDRLPEGKGAYLIYHNNSAANIAIYSGSDYWSYGYYSNRIYPTHWMPLPAAPEDK